MQPVLLDSRFGTARDIGSWVWGATFKKPQMYQHGGVTHVEVNWDVATAASLTLYISDTAAAGTTYGMVLKGGSTTVNTLHKDEFNIKASTYFNLCFGVTTTINWMTVTERTVW